VGSLLLVRHARAGLRGTGPEDLDRALDEDGRAQAAALPDLLRPHLPGADLPGEREVVDVRSSPARRCRETLAPLGAELGVPVTVDPALLEGCDVRVLLARLEGLTGHAVWASHGDVIPELLMMLARRGVDLGPDPRCAKGSTWVLQVADGEVRSADYLAPPR
jgi:phosphohistidine phosphatase SixA